MDIPYTVKARPDTGLWNAKVGIWLFLASEVMLFGGLFSAYIFLRIGADFPWPVHVLTVRWGFINTLVLIFSSVTVLQAWLALKMRKWGMFKIWMTLTIACAGAFMCIKAVEYNDKFHHYGVQLNDGSVLEGHLLNNEYLVKFGNVTTVTLSTRLNDVGLMGISLVNPASDAGFLKYLVDGKPEFKDESGKSVTLNSSAVAQLLAEAIKAKKPTIKLTAVAPLKFNIEPARLANYDQKKATFRDGTEITGTLEDDTMRLLVDKVDLRRLIPVHETKLSNAAADVSNADAWKVLGPEWKDKFVKHNQEQSKEFGEKHKSQEPLKNGDFVREAFTMEISLHESSASDHQAKPESKDKETHKAAESVGHGAPAHAAEGGGHHDHPEIAIEKKDIHFYSNFTPKYNNFFAIYFALTGLHGLHVIGGAIVLSYFLIFGKKMFQEDPERLANRVETGGLFWHFVDLVWIFLFPLLYLM